MTREVLAVKPILGEFMAHLGAALAARAETARVTWQVPTPRPTRFVKVQHTSTNRLSVAHAETFITCECWELTGAGADNLGSLVYAIASSAELPSGAYCPQGSRGTLAAPYALDDPDTGLPRSLFTVRFIVPVEAI